MKTLREHNESVARGPYAAMTVNAPAGIACECGAELRYRDNSIMNMSNPPSHWVDCPGCGATGLMYS